MTGTRGFPPAVVAALVVALGAAAVASGSAGRSARPTVGMCAGAWNRTAPPSVLAWERRRRVWQATVQASTAVSFGSSWRRGHVAATKPVRTVATCVVVLFAPRGGATILMGAWSRGTVASWAPHEIGPAPDGSGNACVARNGTIHRVGRFTARTRCPRAA